MSDRLPQPGDSSELLTELRSINNSLRDIKSQLATPQAPHPEHKAEEDKKARQTSRMTLTIGFGLIGAKLGGIIGAKIGAIKHFMSSENKRAMAEITNAAVPDGKKVYATIEEFVKVSGKWALIAAIPGAIGGAWLGWKRGDRIEHPGDIITKPFESLGKIFGSAPPKKDGEDKGRHHSHAASQQDVTDKNWQNRLDQSKTASFTIER